MLILPLGLALALSSELVELALWLEVWFCQSLLQSLGAGEEDISGSLLRDVCSVSGSLPQTKSLSFRSGISTPKLGSLLWTRRLHSERTVCAPGRLCWEGGTRSLSQNRGWEIFIGFGWHLSPPCKPICLRRRRPPGIATQDLHIQQHTPTPSYGTAAHGPAPPPPPTIPPGSRRTGKARARSPFFGDMAPVPSTNTPLAKGFPTPPLPPPQPPTDTPSPPPSLPIDPAPHVPSPSCCINIRPPTPILPVNPALTPQTHLLPTMSCHSPCCNPRPLCSSHVHPQPPPQSQNC